MIRERPGRRLQTELYPPKTHIEVLVPDVTISRDTAFMEIRLNEVTRAGP